MQGLPETLPSASYISMEVLREEKRAIFLRHWLFACHVSELARAGDYVTLSILDQSLFVVRTDLGDLRAFFNVCSHRAHELLQGRGNCRAIVCPYHGWTYRHDGTLSHLPNETNVARLDKSRHGLRQIRVETVASFVYVNMDAQSPTLASQAPAWPEAIAVEFPYFQELRLINRDRRAARANWKVVMENFLECYHCRPTHKAFCSLFDIATYRYQLDGIYSTQLAAARNPADAWYRFSPADHPRRLVFWGLFPNTMFSLFPGTSSVGVMSADPDPADPSRCTLRMDTYATKPAKEVFNKEFVDLLGKTLDEDVARCESVQRGLRSHGYDRGPLLIDDGLTGQSEHAVQHFQEWIRAAMSKDQA